MQQFRQAAATSISCSTSFAFDFKSTKKMRATASFETNSICLTIIRLKIETQVACVLTIPYKNSFDLGIHFFDTTPSTVKSK
jgi:hypothetical protein